MAADGGLQNLDRTARHLAPVRETWRTIESATAQLSLRQKRLSFRRDQLIDAVERHSQMSADFILGSALMVS